MSNVVEVDGAALKRACDLLSAVPAVPAVKQSEHVGVARDGDDLLLSLSSTIAVVARLKGCALEVPADQAITRTDLLPFVRDASKPYKLEPVDGKIVIKQGRRRASLLTVAAEWSYGEWVRDDVRAIKLPEGFGDTLAAVMPCAARGTRVAALSGIAVWVGDSGTRALASDDLTIAAAGIAPEASQHAIVPVPLADLLAKESPAQLDVSGYAVGFESDCVRVWAQAPQAAWERFPTDRIGGVLESARSVPAALTCGAKELQRVCRDFGGYLGGTARKGAEIEFGTREGETRVRARHEHAEYVDTLESQAAEGETLFSVGHALLAPIADRLAGGEDDVVLRPDAAYIHISAGAAEYLLGRKSG